MRLFVGLPVPATVGEVLLGAARELAGVEAERLRWSAAEDLHVTLQFLGEAAEEQVACVEGAMRALAGWPAMELEVEGLGVFATAGVLLGAVRPEVGLSGLVRGLAEGLRGCGFAPELRPYRPHVTLARSRRGLSGEMAARWTTDAPRVSFAAREMVLYESGRRTGERVRYAPLVRVALREG